MPSNLHEAADHCGSSQHQRLREAVHYHAKHGDEWEASLLVVGTEPPGQFPVNLLFCDAEGESLVVRVNDSSGMPMTVQ